MVKTLERDRYTLCEKHVIVPFCCSYQVYRYLAGCFGLISCRHYLKYHIDLAIVRKYLTGWQRLRHEKTGYTSFDRWYWNQTPNLTEIEEKASRLNHDGLWEEVRIQYLDKKNLYLQRNDHNHSSFIVYIETINETFNKFYRSNGWSSLNGTRYVRK